MRVWSYVDRVALDDLRCVERPDPSPGPRDVVLRMRAAALNYRDLAIASGTYHARVSPPLVPLSDGVGDVVEIGSAVTRVKVGDLACPVYLPDWIDGVLTPRFAERRLGGPTDGVLAEYMCLCEDDLVRAPANLEPEEAATLPVAAVTAWHSLYERSQLRPGQLLAVQGAGGVSAAALLLGRAGGAEVVVGTRVPQRAAALTALGAHGVIDATDPDWPRELRRRCGRGADIVLDVAGGASLKRSIAATRVGGQVHLVGYVAELEAPVDIFEAIRHAVTIHVASAGHRRSFEEMVRAVELSGSRPPVAQRFSVEQIALGMQALKAGGHLGKIVLTF